jgi:hypothetical protein
MLTFTRGGDGFLATAVGQLHSPVLEKGFEHCLETFQVGDRASDQ